MPGFDGTGPRGLGSMTGGGGGFCILKVPRTSAEPLTGFAGLAGRQVGGFDPESQTHLAPLQTQARCIEMNITNLKRRITALEEFGKRRTEKQGSTRRNTG